MAWLEDHQYEEIANIKECRELDENLAEMLCKIFQVKYEGTTKSQKGVKKEWNYRH